MRKLLLSVFFLTVPLSVWAWTTTNHFNTETTSDGWYMWQGAGVGSITNTQSAPGSSPNSFQVMLPPLATGSVTTAGESFVFPSPTKEFWMQYYFKYSSNFQFNLSGNKQIYAFTTNTNQDYMVINSNTFGNPKLGVIYNNSIGFIFASGPNIGVNQWYKVVIHSKIVSTGNDVFQLWVDDALVINEQSTTVLAGGDYSASFNKVSIDPVWGGSTEAHNVTDYQWYDYAIVSTNPIDAVSGGGGGQNILKTPNYPNPIGVK